MHEVICVLISIIIIMKIVREIPLLWMIPPTFELEDKKTHRVMEFQRFSLFSLKNRHRKAL